MSAGVQVRGNATAEELAVVVALICQAERGAAADRYAQWRDARLAALQSRPLAP